MKHPEKPNIIIGYSTRPSSDYSLALEISYGIEEEGCLSELLSFDEIEDVVLCAKQLALKSQVGVSVAVHDDKAALHCLEMKSGQSLLSLKSKAPEEYRRLGKNAARYLKNIRFEL